MKLFQLKNAYAVSRVERCKELMRRQSAKRWNSKKVARMVRRLLAAETLVTQSDQTLDQLKFRLNQQSS